MVVLTDRRTDGQGDSYNPKKHLYTGSRYNEQCKE